jgi:hypothetical protein
MKIALIAFVCLYVGVYSHPTLEGLIPSTNHRYSTFSYILKWLDTHPAARTVIETGTSRGGKKNCLGDGCFTVIMSTYIRNRTIEFYSVDINQKAIDAARAATLLISLKTHYTTGDSVAFLQSFKGQVDIAYLDSFDFDGNNPKPSQQHHLKEVEAVYGKLTRNSLVLIDDCRLVHGGKCSLVERYLLDRGFVLVIDDYQKVFRPPTQADIDAALKVFNSRMTHMLAWI